MTTDLAQFAARLRELIPPSSFVGDDVRSSAPHLPLNPRPWGLGTGNDTFASLALELFYLQFHHNAAYRRICEARHSTPLTVQDWTQIPAVPTAAFKELELTCLPPEQRLTAFHSSGTTEQRPSRHFHNASSLAVYEASLWSWFAPCVLPGFESEISNLKLLILTPPPEQSPHSSLVHMFEVVRRQLGADRSAFIGHVTGDGAWQLDFDATLASLTDFGLQASDSKMLLLGTAFSFVHLLDFLAEKNVRLQLPPGSRVMETGGYKGRSRSLPKPELHALIVEWLGVCASDIICEYGMSELSSQAYDSLVPRPASLAPRVFHFPPWARAQIISPETGREVADGETGLIRVFDLANVFSVLAIQTGDLGVRRGDGFELLGRAAQAEPRGCSLMAAEK